VNKEKPHLGGVIHTYQKFDPKNFPSPTQPPPDMVSGAFEHLLMYGDMRELSDEELARAVRIDPRQIGGLGPSLDALRQMLLERKRKILEKYETAGVQKAVLRRYRDGIGAMLLEPAWRGIDDPVERIFALLASYRAMLVASDCLYGCPIGSLALELHEPDPPVRELLSVNFAGWVGAIESCLRAAEDRVPSGTDTHRLAQFVLTVMEGGVMQSRTHRTPQAFDAGVASLRDYFNRLREAALREERA